MKIRQNQDPVLRQPTQEVENFDVELENLIDDMVATMRKSNGVGLAAPQIGISKKIIVLEYAAEKNSRFASFPLTVLCNPRIVKHSKEERKMVEGCLSFPGLEILVNRPTEVTVEGLDRYGHPVRIEAKDLFARVLQHETDHLYSTLLIDHIRETDLIFIGTGNLGAPALETLACDPQYRVKLVITGENNTIISRQHEKIENPIESIAKKYKLPLIKTANINDPEIVAKIAAAKPEIGIMADFGQIIKKPILDLPPQGIINIHPSLLPAHRGPSPIQQTILDGDTETGVTFMLTADKMDAGDIIAQVLVKLRNNETSTILKNFLAQIAASHLLDTLPYYLAGDLEPVPQRESGATFSRLFKKADGFVDSDTPAVEVERKIRAFDQWPKVYTIAKNMRVILLSAHFDQQGELIIDRVKPEGRKEMSYEEFRRGYRITLTFKR